MDLPWTKIEGCNTSACYQQLLEVIAGYPVGGEGGTVVNASSTTQHCVTISTSETEYVAVAQGAKTASFTKVVLDFLQAEHASEIIDLFEDNQGAIAIAENPISGGRTKHIDVRYLFIRELVERKVPNIPHTESRNQHADILTKPLGLEAFA